MALGGYDNVVKQGLQLLGILDADQSDGRSGTSVFFEAVSKGVTPKKVELRGRAVPYRKVSWGVSQRVNTIWYPGNPVATQQILGPEEDDTVMKGMWKSAFMEGAIIVDGDPISTDIEDTVKLFSDMCRLGIVWRVSWLDQVRKGIITRFTPTWDRQTDCAWELNFQWSSRDDEDNFGLFIPDAEKNSLDLLGKINKVLDTIAAGPLVVKQLVAMVLNDIRAIQDTVSKAISILASVETLLSAPAFIIGALKAAVSQLARQVNVANRRIAGSTAASANAISNLSVVRSGVRSGDNIRTKGQSLVSGTADDNPPAGIPDETADKLASGAVDPTQSGLGANTGGSQSASASSGQLQFESWRRDVAAQFVDVFFTLQQAVDLVIKRSTPTILRLVTAREGDTLYSISVREYGSPDYANWLASANNLRSAIVEPGFQIRIPTRPTGPSEDATIGSGDQIGPQGTGV